MLGPRPTKSETQPPCLDRRALHTTSSFRLDRIEKVECKIIRKNRKDIRRRASRRKKRENLAEWTCYRLCLTDEAKSSSFARRLFFPFLQSKMRSLFKTNEFFQFLSIFYLQRQETERDLSIMGFLSFRKMTQMKIVHRRQNLITRFSLENAELKKHGKLRGKEV